MTINEYPDINDEIGIITLVTGTLSDGSDHYAYVKISPDRYSTFLEAQTRGHYNIHNFGEVLAHGKGKKPTKKVKQAMEKKYHIRDDFEEILEEIMYETFPKPPSRN